MKYLLAVPVVILLAAAFYIFYVYDPNPSKNTNNEVSITRDETKQTGSPKIGATAVTDAAELAIAPVTLPIEEESSDEASSNEENQAGIAASDEESSSEIAISEETESVESFVSTAGGNRTEETTTSIAIDASTQEPVTSTAVDESLEETSTPAAAEEFIEESSPEDATAKRVTYVESGSADSPQAASFGEDYSPESATQVEVKQSQSIVADEQQPLSGGYTEHKAVISSSLSQAASDAGMSANQSARIGRIFKPYIDSSRELRKGDELTIFLDPGAAKTGNDADQIHRLEFHGVRKNLVVTRKEGSLNDYEVRDADGKMLSGGISNTSIAVAPPQREVSVEPASAVEEPQREVSVEPASAVEEHRREVSVEPVPAVERPRREVSVEPAPAIERSRREVVPVETAQHSAADYNAAKGEMKRLEGVVSITLFSAAKEAGLSAVQLKKLEEIMNPYMDFNKDVRKGDRILITLDGSEIYSSEFNGAVKKLTVARDDDGTYREVKPGDIDIIPSESGDNSSTGKLPFWKRWWNRLGSSSDGSGGN